MRTAEVVHHVNPNMGNNTMDLSEHGNAHISMDSIPRHGGVCLMKDEMHDEEDDCVIIEEPGAEDSQDISHLLNPRPASPTYVPAPELAAQVAKAFDVLRNGDIAKAEEWGKQLITLDPHYEKAIELLETVLYMRGRPNDAINMLYEAMEGHPRRASVFVAFGEMYTRRRQFENAFRCFQTAKDEGGNEFKIATRLGNMYSWRRDWRVAIKHYKRAYLIKGPTLLDMCKVGINIARCFFELREYENSQTWATRAVYFNTQCSEAWVMEARLLEATGRLTADVQQPRPRFDLLDHDNFGQGTHRLAALNAFEKAIDIDPMNIFAYVHAADLMMRLQMFPRAEAALGRALYVCQHDHKRGVVFNKLSVLFFHKMHYERAAYFSEKALETNGGDPDYLLNYANALVELGRFNKAMTIFKRLLDIPIEELPARGALPQFVYARLQYKMHDLRGAFKYGMKALKFVELCERVDPPLYTFMGMVLRDMGLVDKAKDMFVKAFRADTKHVPAYVEMAKLLTRLGYPDVAVDHLKRALVVKPGSTVAHVELAKIYQEREIWTEAAKHWLEASLSDPFCTNLKLLAALGNQLLCNFSKSYEKNRNAVYAIRDALSKKALVDMSPVNTYYFKLGLVERNYVNYCYVGSVFHKLQLNKFVPFAHLFPPKPFKRLRLGYISSYFGNSEIGRMTQAIPGHHNRTYVEVFVYALNRADQSISRRKIEDEPEHFLDLSDEESDMAIAKQIYEDNIQILVDLDGFRPRARPGVLALRPAVLQVGWLASPASLHCPWYDYHVSDGVITPKNRLREFNERVIYTPHTLLIGDHVQMYPNMRERIVYRDRRLQPVIRLPPSTPGPSTSGMSALQRPIMRGPIYMPEKRIPQQGELRVAEVVIKKRRGPHEEEQYRQIRVLDDDDILPSRQRYNLPEEVTVFFNFDSLSKAEPSTLDLWAEILRQVPRSILWLLRTPLEAECNVMKYMRRFPIDPRRIIWADPTGCDEHIHRCQLGDVCLDTTLISGTLTNLDCLWAGTPVVTLKGKEPTQRYTSSVLLYHGFSELIAKTSEEYIDVAVRMGIDRNYYSLMRSKIFKARLNSSLFNVKQYAGNLDRAYEKIWKIYLETERTQHVTEFGVRPKDMKVIRKAGKMY